MKYIFVIAVLCLPCAAQAAEPTYAGLDKPFVQTGAGAVPRTLYERSQDWVSVKDFGAKCDGKTDDSMAFQRAIDAYKNIIVPAGTCIIDAPLHVMSDLSIKGEKRKSILKKTTTTAETIRRTYVDAGDGTTRTLTWSDPVVFNLVAPNNSYLVDFQIDGMSFDLPAAGTVGVFNAQRVAYSSFRNLYVNSSAYFIKGWDLFMVDFTQIRSRFSRNHFDIDTGTSNTFTNVAVDTKHAGGGTGFTFRNLKYTTMVSSGADAVDRAYYFDHADVTMLGCGAESFSRILQVVNGSNVTIQGGMLAVYKSGSAKGTYYPYVFDGANTTVAISGSWIGIKNPARAGGDYAAFTVQNGAQVTMNGVRYPVELGTGNWYYMLGANSSLSVFDKNGNRYINANGVSRRDAVNNIKSFEYSKTVPAGAMTPVFRIAGGGRGASAAGRIKVYYVNATAGDAGFAGYQEYSFAAASGATRTQSLARIGGTDATFDSAGPAFASPSAQMARNADGSVDFQVATPAGYGSTQVTVMVEYMNQVGTTPAPAVLGGL